MSEFNKEEFSLSEILKPLPGELANMQLPDPALRDYYKDDLDRIIWIDDTIDDETLNVVKKIRLYNLEDTGKPVEERKPIRIFIDTLGGSVVIMWSLINAIKLSKTPVWTINWCSCMSAGAHILAAGHKRLAMPGSTVLIHSGSCTYSGTQEQAESAKKYYDSITKKADMVLLESTKIDPKVLKKKSPFDWYLDTNEALSNGIIDKVIEDFEEIA